MGMSLSDNEADNQQSQAHLRFTARYRLPTYLRSLLRPIHPANRKRSNADASLSPPPSPLHEVSVHSQLSLYRYQYLEILPTYLSFVNTRSFFTPRSPGLFSKTFLHCFHYLYSMSMLSDSQLFLKCNQYPPLLTQVVLS